MSSNSYQYCFILQSIGSLDVSDISNVNIKAFSDDGETYVLMIKTTMGITKIIEYGPYNVDLGLQHEDSVVYSYKKIDYSEYKINNIIDKFLNNPKRCITQALIVDDEEARQNIESLVNQLDDSY